jgi:hypothetical protein
MNTLEVSWLDLTKIKMFLMLYWIKQSYLVLSSLDQKYRYLPDVLKVHKHEIFLNTFLQKPNLYGPKGL